MKKFLTSLNLKTFLVAFTLATVLFSAYHISFAKKIIPGVTVGGVALGGTDYHTAADRLKNADPPSTQELVVKYKDEEYKISLESLDLYYDWDSSIKRAYEVGRTGNVLVDLKDKIAGLVKPLKIGAYYSYNKTALDNFIAGVTGDLDSYSVDAKFVYDDKLSIQPESVGKKVARDDLYKKIVYALSTRSFKEISVEVVEDNPKITKRDLEKLQAEAQKLVENPFLITFGDQELELSAQEKASFITVDPKDKALSLNKGAFENFLNVFRLNVYESPRGKVKKSSEDRVESFEITTSGRDLDFDRFTQDFKDAFFSKKSQVAASIKEVKGPQDAQKYGIYALLGKGTSKFTGSAQARINNLTLAADRTNGVLVPPGGVYSFNNSVGEISAATGYNTAYVISNGKTVLGEGGGVCQTSTTLFRAVLNAGLPVVTRYAHAYRVYYYEIESPVGFDASIYQPSLDFKFQNDTPNYILIQTDYDISTQTLEFSIYGTPDGREVKITEPVVTNLIAPPEAEYQDDPTLPEGTIKQVDFSAWGATVSFDREVTKNGEKIIEDTFKSVYRPWKAVYLVGKKR